jgi:hypothetical protein
LLKRRRISNKGGRSIRSAERFALRTFVLHLVHLSDNSKHELFSKRIWSSTRIISLSKKCRGATCRSPRGVRARFPGLFRSSYSIRRDSSTAVPLFIPPGRVAIIPPASENLLFRFFLLRPTARGLFSNSRARTGAEARDKGKNLRPPSNLVRLLPPQSNTPRLPQQPQRSSLSSYPPESPPRPLHAKVKKQPSPLVFSCSRWIGVGGPNFR